MSVSPTTGMSMLSLEGAPAMEPTRGPTHSARTSPSVSVSERQEDSNEWEESGDDEEDSDQDIITSSTGLKYNISHLSRRTQQVVRGLYHQVSTPGPPQISLELCGIKEEDDADGGFFYAFQMQEVVPCSIRIGSKNSKTYSKPRCECPDARYRNQRPCKHLIWLFDKISKQALYDHDLEADLTLTELGYPEQLHDPFEQISQIRLDILADDLHCDIFDPDNDTAPPTQARIQEAREMVAALAGVQPQKIDTYRRDLGASHYTSSIQRGDLEATLFSLLLSSHSLAEWIRTGLGQTYQAVDPFRSIDRRVSRILSELESYSSSLQNTPVTSARSHKEKTAEGPRDVHWAATQIQHCVRKIDILVSRGSDPLSEQARASAARSLVSILKAVVSRNVDSHGGDTLDDRNLFMRLVGNHDTGFVYSTLELLVDQSQFIEELEGIMDLLGRHGAPTTYVSNMRSLISRMRSHKAVHTMGESTRRRSQTPPMDDTQPPPPPPPPMVSESAEDRMRTAPFGSSSSPQLLTPELPSSSRIGRGSSSRGRGSTRGAGTGSKRSVSSGSAQDSPRGSKKKRARGA
ncbi:hypothetical protein QBC40DRAFT_276383 [Triangularia verruculosa]|uniref:SWIM-type domain-containing protein n=1 Tax=Triangularia verruculosa TaxID=2587418 RepID=A0AAN7AWN8_9PEZI|nr:hypothetical protein QBC40DRAFT_276383 [Triangularia verruculosa]